MAQPNGGAKGRPIAYAQDFPQTGFLRLSAILAPNGPIPIGRSTWWAGVKDGRFPKPIKLGARITAWRVEDIRAFIENGG
jgi:prophage regulatory protein